MRKPTMSETIFAQERLCLGILDLKQAIIEIDRARQLFPELDKFHSDLQHALHEASKKEFVKRSL